MATAADVFFDAIHDWGVEVIFGLPGDGINGLMEALRQRQDKIRFIQVRHEEAAAFMACGYAKFTGKLGVCLTTSGPGGLHLINGLYDAKLDGQPVLAITGMPYHDLIATRSQQDVELDKVFADVAVYNARVMGPNHVENVADLACRSALAYHGVAHVGFPVDFQEAPLERSTRSRRNVAHHTSDVFARSARLPQEEDLRRAAEVLNAGKKVAILAGRGALRAGDELEQTADVLAAPIIKALLGKAAVPDDSPFTTGGIGLLGTRPSWDAIEQCDTLLMVGTSFPYIEFLPGPDQARAVQIDYDPQRIGLRYPVDVGLVGDCRASLQVLLPMLKRHSDRAFLEAAQAGMQEWRELMDQRGMRTAKPIKPQVVARELGLRLADDAIVACDSGTVTTWWARHIPVRKGQMHSVSGTLASMGCALPYAIAAQIAHPKRPCIAFAGDGGFSMLMAEFATCVKYRLPVKVVVLRNNSLGMIKWEQMTFLGNPEFGCELQPIDFAAFAQACGGTGFHLEDPADCEAVIEEALATPGPVIVDALVDPYEPPMPPRVTLAQTANLAKALIRGEPDGSKILTTVLGNRIREMI
jgi:pyruvate dehydrogenase (quinone)